MENGCFEFGALSDTAAWIDRHPMRASAKNGIFVSDVRRKFKPGRAAGHASGARQFCYRPPYPYVPLQRISMGKEPPGAALFGFHPPIYPVLSAAPRKRL